MTIKAQDDSAPLVPHLAPGEDWRDRYKRGWEYLAVVYVDGKELGSRELVDIRLTLEDAQREAQRLENIYAHLRRANITVKIVVLRRRVSPWERFA
jgi:hypothetical protein